MESPLDWDDSHGAPGGVWARLSLFPRGGREPKTAAHSAQALDDFSAFLSSPFERASLKLWCQTEAGSIDQSGASSIELVIDVENSADPGWMQMSVVTSGGMSEADPGSRAACDRWAMALGQFADRTNRSGGAEVGGGDLLPGLAGGVVGLPLGSGQRPAYGQIYTDTLSIGWTGLDTVLRRGGRTGSLRERRKFLRGYSWSTVIPEELSEQVGGVSGLQEAGTLSEVRRLSNGGLWVRATSDVASFGQPQVESVFAALKPVLPPGMPKKDPFAQADGRLPRLVWRDAAES